MSQSSNPSMDMGEPSSSRPIATAPTKRLITDLDGVEMPDPKRNRAPQDKTTKLNLLMFIIHFHEEVKSSIGIHNNENIDTLADITSLMLSLHTRLRQELNGVGGIKDKVSDDKICKIAGANFRVGDALDLYKVVAALYGVEYVNTQGSQKVVGMVTSFLTLIASFRDRFNEARVGINKIIVKKSEVTQKETYISTVGLDTKHQVTLKGANFTPSKQSAMKGSLGPMTVALNLMLSENARYAETWERVFVQVFKLIPNAAGIARYLARTRAKHPNIMKLLADICLFGVTRSANKAFFPIALILSAARSNVNYQAFWANRTSENLPSRQGQKMTTAMLCPVLINLDFSGHGALGLWQSVTKMIFRIKAQPDCSTRVASEMVFHGVWGTHTEDLGYLQALTDHAFLTRREIGTALQNRGTSDHTAIVNIYSFKYFAKLVNAAQSKVLSGGSGQVKEMPCFSGTRQTDVDLDSEWIHTLKEDVEGREQGHDLDDHRIQMLLMEVKSRIYNQLAQGRSVITGTVKHVTVPEDCDGSSYGAEVNEPFRNTGRFFYE